ncbi:unnamed protein product [Meganyctiphanes norvegica]|uniref:Uncharacterized protein n=1 Tax=Meganyctiphanes norvegica TaxID=48144 RepID=A0AAV2RTB6_MEGNR
MEKEEIKYFEEDYGNDTKTLQQNEDQPRDFDNSLKLIKESPMNLSKDQLADKSCEGEISLLPEKNECKSFIKENQTASGEQSFNVKDCFSNETSLTKSYKEDAIHWANKQISSHVEGSVNVSSLSMDSFHKKTSVGTNSSDESIEENTKETCNDNVHTKGNDLTANFSPPGTTVKKSLLKRNNIYNKKDGKELNEKQSEEIKVGTTYNKESDILENPDKEKINNTESKKYISKDVESKSEENVNKDLTAIENISKEKTKQLVKGNYTESKEDISKDVESKSEENIVKITNTMENICKEQTKQLVKGNYTESCVDISKDVENISEENSVKITTTIESIRKEQTNQLVKGNYTESNIDISKDTETENEKIIVKRTSENIGKEQTKQCVTENYTKSNENISKHKDNIGEEFFFKKLTTIDKISKEQTKQLVKENYTESNENISKDIDNEIQEIITKNLITSEQVCKEQTKQLVQKSSIESNLKSSHDLSSKETKDESKKVMIQCQFLKGKKEALKHLNQSSHQNFQINEASIEKSKVEGYHLLKNYDVEKNIESVQADQKEIDSKENAVLQKVEVKSTVNTSQEIKNKDEVHTSVADSKKTLENYDDEVISAVNTFQGKRSVEEKHTLDADSKKTLENKGNEVKSAINTFQKKRSEDDKPSFDADSKKTLENKDDKLKLAVNTFQEKRSENEKHTIDSDSKITVGNKEKNDVFLTKCDDVDKEIKMIKDVVKDLSKNKGNSKCERGKKLQKTFIEEFDNSQNTEETKNLPVNIKDKQDLVHADSAKTYPCLKVIEKKENTEDLHRSFSINKYLENKIIKSNSSTKDFSSQNVDDIVREESNELNKNTDKMKTNDHYDKSEVECRQDQKCKQKIDMKIIADSKATKTQILGSKILKNNEDISTKDINNDNNLNKPMSSSIQMESLIGNKKHVNVATNMLEEENSNGSTKDFRSPNVDDIVSGESNRINKNTDEIKTDDNYDNSGVECWQDQKCQQKIDMKIIPDSKATKNQISASKILKCNEDISTKDCNNDNNLNKPMSSSIQMKSLHGNKKHVNMATNMLEEKNTKEVIKNNELCGEKSLESEVKIKIISSLKDSIRPEMESDIQENKEELKAESKNEKTNISTSEHNVASHNKISKVIEKNSNHSNVTSDKNVECVTLSSDSEEEFVNEPYVCERCENIWSNKILNKLFKGDEPVTVNSRITYGAIILINRWVVKHYDGDREELVRSVLERADLGKNVENLRISQVNKWLGGLMRSGKIKCCDVFAAVYKAPISNTSIKQIETIQMTTSGIIQSIKNTSTNTLTPPLTSGIIQNSKNTSAAYKFVASGSPIVVNQPTGLQQMAQLTQIPSPGLALLQSPPAVMSIPKRTLSTPIRVLQEGLQVLPGSVSGSLVPGASVILRSPLQPGVLPVAASTPLAKLLTLSTSTSNTIDSPSKKSEDVMPGKTNLVIKQGNLPSAVDISGDTAKKLDDNSPNSKMANTTSEGPRIMTSAISNKEDSTAQVSIVSAQSSLKSDESQLKPSNSSTNLKVNEEKIVAKLPTKSAPVPSCSGAPNKKIKVLKSGPTKLVLKQNNKSSAVSISEDASKKVEDSQSLKITNTPPEELKSGNSAISNKLYSAALKSKVTAQCSPKSDVSKMNPSNSTMDSNIVEDKRVAKLPSTSTSATMGSDDLSKKLKDILPGKTNLILKQSNLLSSVSITEDTAKKVEKNSPKLKIENAPPKVPKSVTSAISNKAQQSTVSAKSGDTSGESQLEPSNSITDHKLIETISVAKLPTISTPTPISSGTPSKKLKDLMPEQTNTVLDQSNLSSPVSFSGNIEKQEDKIAPNSKMPNIPSEVLTNENSAISNKKVSKTQMSLVSAQSIRKSEELQPTASNKLSEDKTEPSSILPLSPNPNRKYSPLNKEESKDDRSEQSNMHDLYHSPKNESHLKKLDSEYDKTVSPDISKLSESINNGSPLKKTDSKYGKTEHSYITHQIQNSEKNESQLKKLDSECDKTESPDISNLSESINNGSPLKKTDSKYGKTEHSYITQQIKISDENESQLKKINSEYDKTESPDISKLSESINNGSPLKKKDGKYDKTEPSNVLNIYQSPDNNDFPLEKNYSQYDITETSFIHELSPSTDNERPLKIINSKYDKPEPSNIPNLSHRLDNNECPLKKIDSICNIKESMEEQKKYISNHPKDTGDIPTSNDLLTLLNLNPDTVNSFGVKYNNNAVMNQKVKSKAIYKNPENMKAIGKLKEEFEFISGHAAKAFGLMPFESSNFYDPNINEDENLNNRFLTNREILSLQDICVFSPENPNVELFYEILAMLLKSRKTVLLIPDEECLIKVTENIRKEYIRSKKQRTSHIFLNKNWDLDAIYCCVDFWTMTLNMNPEIRKRYYKNITVVHILSLFCCWKNKEFSKEVLNISLQHQIEYICPEIDMKNIDKVGLCIRLYSIYCDFIMIKNEVNLCKIFINQKFLGASTLTSKDDLIMKTGITSTIGKNEMTKKDEITVAKFESQVIQLNKSLNETRNSNQKLKENIKLYKEKKEKLLSALNKSETQSLAIELSKTIEEVHRMRHTIKRKTDEGYLNSPPSKKMKQMNDSTLTESSNKMYEKDEMRKVVIQLLKNKISIDKVRKVIQTIMENVVGIKQVVLPGPQWIRIVAKQEGIALLE